MNRFSWAEQLRHCHHRRMENCTEDFFPSLPHLRQGSYFPLARSPLVIFISGGCSSPITSPSGRAMTVYKSPLFRNWVYSFILSFWNSTMSHCWMCTAFICRLVSNSWNYAEYMTVLRHILQDHGCPCYSNERQLLMVQSLPLTPFSPLFMHHYDLSEDEKCVLIPAKSWLDITLMLQ
jgi:hypothetical protein